MYSTFTEESYVQYIDNIIKKYCPDYTLMGSIVTELHGVLFTAPTLDNKEKYIHAFLDQQFGNVDLNESFKTPIILLHNEGILLEELLYIHSWFSNRCCNLDNIFLILAHGIGIKEWYNRYLELFGQKGFNIIEMPMRSLHFFNGVELAPKPAELTKNLKYYFSSWIGGFTNKLERDFLAALLLSRSDIGAVDYRSGYVSTEQEFENYLEQITNFSNRALVEQLISNRQSIKFITDPSKYNETTPDGKMWFMQPSDFQNKINSTSFFQIVREATMSTPYTLITEKTIKCFLNFQITLPTSGVNSVANLEKLGFKFDHSLVDYSYQTEPVFSVRMFKILKLIEDFAKTHTLKNLEEYILDNREILWYNYNYITSGDLATYLETQFIKEISSI